MKTLLLMLLFPVALLGAPIAELKLKDGRTLKNVEILGYNPTVLVAKWEGGRGFLKYEDLPEDVQAKTAPLRPKSVGGVATSATKPKAPEPASLPSAEPVAVAIAKPAHQVGKIDGRCFITTRGAGAYKMAGVEVMFFPGAIINAFETNMLTIMLPPPLKTAVTDDEGKFSIELPAASAPWLAVAQGKRYVGSLRGGDPEEHYEWIVPIEKDATSVVLNSANHRSTIHVLRVQGR